MLGWTLLDIITVSCRYWLCNFENLKYIKQRSLGGVRTPEHSSASELPLHEQKRGDRKRFVNIFHFRCLFLPVHSPSSPPEPHDEAQHHVPDVRLSPGIRRLVLPQRGNLLHRQDRTINSLQLRVSFVDIRRDCEVGGVITFWVSLIFKHFLECSQQVVQGATTHSIPSRSSEGVSNQ